MVSNLTLRDYSQYVSELSEESNLARKKQKKENIQAKLKNNIDKSMKVAKGVGKKVKKINLTKQPKGYKNLQKGVNKVYSKTYSQLKKQRAYDLKMAKLRTKERMAELRIQAEQLAMQQDPRYSQDSQDFSFVGPNPQHESDVASFKQQLEMQQYSQEEPYERRFRRKRIPFFLRNRLKPRNLLNYENNFNKPDGTYNPQGLTLMQGTPRAERLKFTTSPNAIKTNTNTKPIKVNFLGTKPTKVTVFGKTKL